MKKHHKVKESDIDTILHNLKLYLDTYPQKGKKVRDEVEKMAEKPKFTDMSCPFCCEAVYIYRSGKKICRCLPGYGGMS